ncbi:cytochrome c biogenesis CcdA family protein [Nocardia ninae]|uniref:Cytochrome C biogenesis protein CcdA n=1 Tax=Nocardia ninae NBRC 108245 TaxID=1210091 RepID=A0A511M777_9NOCA|nr:cytochrome c biogenesis CcdA family protein [Nocardia ninae]GEM36503.1 cytochrome C biogenesis protein CcdA [Nocardia ninae NBRC 108245]
MGELLIGTTLLASFLGGVVALLAPCCVSVMLPAYLATGFRHRGGVVPATLVFGAGVATVILPIGLGATILSRLFIEQHVWVFSIGATLMVIGGVAVLIGWKPNLPMPGARTVREGSFSSAYLLGAFSGIASACCAPVLVGVAVLSGASGSFPVALTVGLSYVAGMVTPLALVALVWDRRREQSARLFTDRSLRIRVGRWQRDLAVGTALSGVLMIGMGVLTGVLAFTGAGMSAGGWQSEVSAWLQHLSARIQDSVSWLPGGVVAALLLAGTALLIRRSLRARQSIPDTRESNCCAEPSPAPIPESVEEKHQ